MYNQIIQSCNMGKVDYNTIQAYKNIPYNYGFTTYRVRSVYSAQDKIRELNTVHMQVYAEPLGYWKNYYNLFDFTVLIISILQSILTALNFGQTGLTVLKVVRG